MTDVGNNPPDTLPTGNAFFAASQQFLNDVIYRLAADHAAIATYVQPVGPSDPNPLPYGGSAILFGSGNYLLGLDATGWTVQDHLGAVLATAPLDGQIADTGLTLVLATLGIS